MRISLELDQQWATAEDLLKYLGKLERTLQRICEMEADSPTDWFLEVKTLSAENLEFNISFTHL